MCAVTNATSYIAFIQTSRDSVFLPRALPVAALRPVSAQSSSPAENSAAIKHLSHDEKLAKVLRELNFEEIQLPAVEKIAQRSLVAEFVDAFDESDNDDCTKSIVFHEIDTADVRPLPQAARRIAYVEQREEIDKLLEASIA